MMIDVNKEDACRGLNAGVESNKNSPTKNSAKGGEAADKRPLERSVSESPKSMGKKNKAKKGNSSNVKEDKDSESPNRARSQRKYSALRLACMLINQQFLFPSSAKRVPWLPK